MKFAYSKEQEERLCENALRKCADAPAAILAGQRRRRNTRAGGVLCRRDSKESWAVNMHPKNWSNSYNIWLGKINSMEEAQRITDIVFHYTGYEPAHGMFPKFREQPPQFFNNNLQHLDSVEKRMRYVKYIAKGDEFHARRKELMTSVMEMVKYIVEGREFHARYKELTKSQMEGMKRIESTMERMESKMELAGRHDKIVVGSLFGIYYIPLLFELGVETFDKLYGSTLSFDLSPDAYENGVIKYVDFKIYNAGFKDAKGEENKLTDEEGQRQGNPPHYSHTERRMMQADVMYQPLEEPDEHEHPEWVKVDDSDDEGLSDGSSAMDESQAEVTGNSPCHETNPNYPCRKRKSIDEGDLIGVLGPFIKQQIEEALNSTLLPLVSVLRSREEDEQKHREQLLALEKEKLALKRTKLLFKRRGVVRSQPAPPRASYSARSGYNKRLGIRGTSPAL